MTSLADRFVEALRSLDAATMTQLLAPDAIGWRNFGERRRTVHEITSMLEMERILIRSSSLEVRHQATTEDGFVVQLVFAGTTCGGADFRVPLCIVAQVVDGRVSHFDEYADEATLEPLKQELLRSTSSGATAR